MHLKICQQSMFLFFYLHLILSELRNITDISICKLSHLGLDYIGHISKTESGILCQSWTAKMTIHKVDETIVNDMFPERSMEKARNYCRNPKRRDNGPWCYSMDPELIDDTCGIQLCSYTDCRLTGPGMEYGGSHKKAASGKQCLKWNKRRKKVRNQFGNFTVQEKFSPRRFPDETLGDAKNYCRNPDGDPGGPWCFIEDEIDTKAVRKQYCSIPFCNNELCVTFTKKFDIYTHYTLLNDTISNITFGLKIWNPDESLEANARILLSLFSLPLTGQEINDLNLGIEIFISNKDSAMTRGNKDTPEYEPTINILKSSSYTYFNLIWNSGFVTLTVEGAVKPIFLAEYKWKKDLFGKNRNKFFYYSIQGKNMLWTLPFCDEEHECEVHTTTSNNFERFWPLHKTNSSYDIKFHIRAFHSALLLFQPNPTVRWPRVLLTLARLEDNATKITMEEFEGSQIDLKSIVITKMLNFWDWQSFTVTFFADVLQVYWNRDTGSQIIAEVNHPFITGTRWFSPGSEDTLAHWTFFCLAEDLMKPPPPWLPECVLNVNEIGYNGTQGVTHTGHSCLPWTYNNNIKNTVGADGVIKLWNYCRDPLEDKLGTYCFVVKQKPKREFTKEKCGIRLCRSAECRMAGTGNDYIGKLNKTRSNRTCQHWTKNKPHKIDTKFNNNSLYADQDVVAAENYCRDPSRNIAGPWCYTTDVNVNWDLCDVRDCSKREECIIMTRGSGGGRLIYILPEWKEGGLEGGLHFALKEWNPDLLDGIIFEIIPLDDKPGFLRIIIGAENNERVLIYYSDKNRENANLVKEKSLPHLIPAGKWAPFWLQMRRGELTLGHEGNPDPIFVWQHDNPDSAFEPGFLTYMSIQGNIIGVHFKCTECHTERTNIKYYTRIMPIGLWSTTENEFYNNISIYARGTGILLIPLLLLPNSGDYYGLAIGDEGSYIVFLINKLSSTEILYAKDMKEPALKEIEWTHYLIVFTEYTINVYKDDKNVLTYQNPTPMLFYWFSVGAENGWITWTANCKPPDIDGAPRDGGWSNWSPWTCTVTCGGGDGFRTRRCDNPRPNIRGHLCSGSYITRGRCNEFECGDLSPETLEEIRQRLRENHTSIVVDEGNYFRIENDNKLLKIIQKDSPNAFYNWTINGVIINYDTAGFKFVDDNIIVQRASREYTGVYICVLYRIGGQRVIFRVVTVAIRSKESDIITRETYEMTLTSNSVVLAYVYTDLVQMWYINDSVYIDYGITTLAAVVTENIKPVNYSHNGVWSCHIIQRDLHAEWITNIVKVQVKHKPNLLTHLMEDQFTRLIFGSLKNESTVLIILICIIIVIVALVFTIYVILLY